MARRRISNGALSYGVYRGPRTFHVRNKAVWKDAVRSSTCLTATVEFAHDSQYHQTHNRPTLDLMPALAGIKSKVQKNLDSHGKSLQTQ